MMEYERIEFVNILSYKYMVQSKAVVINLTSEALYKESLL
jgi:hypothetical protein